MYCKRHGLSLLLICESTITHHMAACHVLQKYSLVVCREEIGGPDYDVVGRATPGEQRCLAAMKVD